MTHFYQLWKRVPRSRRKELAKFIHELKKLASANNECLVVERLGNREEDHVYIDINDLTSEQQNALRDKVWALGDKFGIPRHNIEFERDDDWDIPIIICFLYTDY